jgi:hypothetical protein
MLTTPIAYIIFNRPSHTRETFAAIRSRRPARLFIIADGPRAKHPTDIERCREVREIVKEIDWPCEVSRNYADQNLGLKHRVSSGITWVFEQVERAIILEDDCLPHPDFFHFCEVLLERYEKDERVWVITGNNYQNGKRRGDAAYFFSKFNHCWGWASWRRAWQHYRGGLPFWPEWKKSADWQKKTPDLIERLYWAGIFEQVWRGEIDSWDYPWTCSVWYHGGLTATPNVNLVTNIGIGPDATHTISRKEQERYPVHPLRVLTHPEKVEQDLEADRFDFHHNFGGVQELVRFRLISMARKIKKIASQMG